MKPQLKDVVWERDGAELRVVYDIRDYLVLSDPDHRVEALLELLREGGRTLDGLAAALAARGAPVSVDDVAAAVALLDSYGLLEDGRRAGMLLGPERERYFSNLAFFESFATLHQGREDFQLRLRAVHVLVLGTGGLNSHTIPHLCGLGVGRLTLLDRDVVEPRNFARQFLYRQRDLGTRKVAAAGKWVRDFDPTIEVQTLDQTVQGAQQLSDLVRRTDPDVVMSGIDSPRGIDDWVNDACVTHGVPYVRGGMWVTHGQVRSVDPGASACRACVASAQADPSEPGEAAERAAIDLFARKPRVNRGIGPVAGLLGALCAFEVLRYLTRFEPPVYAGRPLTVDFANGCATRFEKPWDRDPCCEVCSGPPIPEDSHRRREVKSR